MVGIKKDMPTTSTNRTADPGAAGPAKAPEPFDDSVTLEDVVARQSIVDGMSIGAPSTTTTAAAKTEAPPASAKVSDPGAVAKMLAGAIGQLEPGESATVGGKVEFIGEVAAGGEANIEIKRTTEGKYQVKIDQRGFLGVGAENKDGHHQTGVKGGFVIAGELTFEVDTAEEATEIAAEATAAAAAGQVLMPGSVGAEVGVGVVAIANRDKVAEVKVELGFGMEADVDFHLGKHGDFIDSEAVVGAGAEATGALVFAPPDEVFLELKVKGEVKGEAFLKNGPASLGTGGEVEGTLTVRIPVGHVGSAEELADPAQQKKFLDEAKKKPAGTTMTFEGKLKTPPALGGVGGTVTIDKTVTGNRLEDLFTDREWHMRGSVDVGPHFRGGVGPVTVEVTAQRNVTIGEASTGTLADQRKELAAKKSQMENQALKAKNPGPARG
jgi:hypothetical protein